MMGLNVGNTILDTSTGNVRNQFEHLAMINSDASDLLLEEGGKADALYISQHRGCGAFNDVEAMAQLGHAVSILGKLWRDNRARTMLTRLAADGSATDRVLRDEEMQSGSPPAGKLDRPVACGCIAGDAGRAHRWRTGYTGCAARHQHQRCICNRRRRHSD